MVMRPIQFKMRRRNERVAVDVWLCDSIPGNIGFASWISFRIQSVVHAIIVFGQILRRICIFLSY
jgi:hypothetical protein